MAMEITPLGPALGGRVTGIDLHRPFDATTAKRIYDAFAVHGVLCFPGQQITASDQIRVASVLGEADGDYRPPSGVLATTNENRGVMLVTNIRKDGRQVGSLPDGEMLFHSDGSHRDRPTAPPRFTPSRCRPRAAIRCSPIWPPPTTRCRTP